MRRLKRIFIYILIISGAFLTSHTPTRNYIKEHTYSFLMSLNNSGLFDNDDTLDHPYLSSYNIRDENNSYYLDLIIKHINIAKISTIKINDYSYIKNEFEINSLEKKITIKLVDNIIFEDNAYFPIYINTIDTSLESFKIDYQTYVFKEIDQTIINQTKTAMVSILAGNDSKIAWGSGVIIKKQFYGLSYDYYVLTNYHVIKDKSSFYVYYEKENSDQIYRVSALNFTIEQVDKNIDLAILKFSTSDSLNHIGDNNQFLTSIPQTVVKGQPVFTISSPEGSNLNFNLVKEGVVIKEKLTVIFEDNDICQDGCSAFQTSISLKDGSSGGGTFDANGQLVGIHFAGPKDYSTSSSIPMSVVLDFINLYFKTSSYKKSPVCSAPQKVDTNKKGLLFLSYTLVIVKT